MKKFALLAIMALATAPAFASQNYKAGNFLLGVGLGIGDPFTRANGDHLQLAVNPSAEIVFGDWAPSGVGLALGLKIDSTVNFINVFSASLAPMAAFHVSFADIADWYVGLGIGFQLIPSRGLRGTYSFGVAFETGFNVYFHKNIGWYIGAGIHADQVFGATGVKFRFGDVKNIKL